jgi:cytochrome c2
VSNHIKAKFCWAGIGTMAIVFLGSTLSISSQAQTTGKHAKELFDKRCGGCHALDRDKEGPRLGGVDGRAAGAVTSFQYSGPLQNSKFVWTDETLDKWLTDPEKMVPDSDMAFHVESADERREIISFLKNASKYEWSRFAP